MLVTKNYDFPLQWDEYVTDRELLEEALTRIDAAIKQVQIGSSEAVNVGFDNTDAGDPAENVQEALDSLFASSSRFELALNATGGANLDDPLWVYSVSRDFMIEAGMPGATGSVISPTPITLDIDVQLNGASIGSIAILDNVFTFTLASNVLFLRDDQLAFIAVNASSFRSVSVTIIAERA